MKSWKSALATAACCLAAAPAAAETAAPEPEPQAAPAAALTDPAQADEQAPDEYRVRMETTRGPVVIAVHREWAPRGADRFYNLVKAGFFEDVAFFRVIPNFMAQFGIHGDPEVSRAWRDATIRDDPVVHTNVRGTITYAKTGLPHSRTTQLFINFKDNKGLDRMGFAPFGEVVEGMEVVDAIHPVGEGAPRGPGPHQGRVQAEGNAYLEASYPKLDYVERAEIVEAK